MTTEKLGDKCLNILGIAVVASLIVVLVCGTIAFGNAVFAAEPLGYYVQAHKTGYTSEIRQDIRFGEDRVVFQGPNGNVWKVYEFLTKPEETIIKQLSQRDVVNM